ncbi:thioredoxin family protein [Quatrionicoccus australiensis]|uniref:thioredoxin family protein n=1 Tax=Quatrionicoccus australiensis TaxID=138118 RepID=UPI001CFB2B5A|nr:thioredoxin family protein [Quatrionicoccus australiensis]MCB4359073.1 thioredoxin family protein [Quatrionicoccus australiensis]
MHPTPDYSPQAPERSEIDALPGPTLLEFGANWCGHCLAAQAPLHAALADQPALRHLKIEDGPGRALGRSFRVKLWPTLVFLQDGREVARLVRPTENTPISEALASLHTGAHPAGRG